MQRKAAPSAVSNGVAAGVPAPIAPSRAYLPKTKAILAVADATCVAAALAVAFRTQLADPAAFAAVERYRIAAAWLLYVAAGYASGVYDNRAVASARAAFAPAAFMSIAGGILTLAVLVSAVPLHTAMSVALAASVAVLVSMFLARIAATAPGLRGVLGYRCLVVGGSDAAAGVMRLAQLYPHAHLAIIGRVQDAPGWHRDDAPEACRMLGTLPSLDELVATHDIDMVIVASPLKGDVNLARRLRAVRYLGIKITDYAALHEELAREIALDHVDERWLFMAATANSRIHARYLKRLTDIVGSALLLVPASLVLAVAAAAIKLNSRGPVLFKQERLGLGAKPFMVLKLRSMYEDAEERTGPMWSTHNDPRITPVGRILRKFRIDELPQLVNVLRGEMSLIGPRPERSVFSDRIAATLPLFMERLMVRPGITGWAQVMAPYAMTVEDSHRKLQFDLYYAKHMSFWLDALIAVKTVKTMIFGRERRQGGITAGQQIASKEQRDIITESP